MPCASCDARNKRTSKSTTRALLSSGRGEGGGSGTAAADGECQRFSGWRLNEWSKSATTDPAGGLMGTFGLSH